MSAEREFDLLLRSWFDESAGPSEPEDLLESILAATRSIRPHPAWFVRLGGGEPMSATRSRGLSRFAPLAVASALVVALLIGVTLLVARPDVGPPPEPGPTAEATPDPGPTAEAAPVPPIIPEYTLAAPGRYTIRGASSGIASARWPRNVSAELPAGWLQYGPARGGGIRAYADTEVTPSGEVLKSTPHVAELTLWSVGNVARNGCPANPLEDEGLMDPPVGRSVEDLAVALSAVPGVTATQPLPASIDGFEGLRINLTVPVQANCTFFQLGRSTRDHRGEAWTFGSLPGWIHEIWIIDVDGLRFVIDAATAPDAPPELRPELQRIIDSIEIQP